MTAEQARQKVKSVTLIDVVKDIDRSIEIMAEAGYHYAAIEPKRSWPIKDLSVYYSNLGFEVLVTPDTFKLSW